MNFYSTLRRNYLSKYYLMIPVSILIVGCSSSFAAMHITMKGMNIFNFIQLAVSVLAAMSYLAAMLAQFSREIVFKVFFISVLIELFLIAFNLIV